LNDNSFSLSKQSQKDVNIFVVICQMADVDTGRVNLRGIVPQDISIAGIARRDVRASLIQKKA
jgi:hypothetical protein